MSAAKSLTQGGATAVAKAAGISRSVIYDGVKELETNASEATTMSSSRQRKPGAGLKFLVDKDADLIMDLNSLIKPFERGDPKSYLRWTCRSLRNLSTDLCGMGHSISHVTVGKLLEQMGYALRSNRKSHEGSSSLDRDAQFQHIHDCVEAFFPKANL